MQADLVLIWNSNWNYGLSLSVRVDDSNESEDTNQSQRQHQEQKQDPNPRRALPSDPPTGLRPNQPGDFSSPRTPTGMILSH
jgi:hypothetical protein